MTGFLLVVLYAFEGCLWGGAAAELCAKVHNNCVGRIGCGMALQNFFLVCDSVVQGHTKECTVPCKQALISLLSTEDRAGRAFLDCSCQGDRVCEFRKHRVEICANDVFSVLHSVDDNSTRVSCTLAQLLCEADTACFTALQFYMRHCEGLLEGESCTTSCNNSLDILYRQVKARKLQTCSCDGTETYDCRRIKENTNVLCFHRESNRLPTHPNKDGENIRGHSGQRSWYGRSGIVTTTLLVVFFLCLQLPRS